MSAKQTFKCVQYDGKVRSAVTLTKANRINSLGTAKVLETTGRFLAGASGVITVVDGITNDEGWQNHHTADLTITAGVSVLSASVPVACWIVGAVFLAADITSQVTTGQSFTQNLFD